VEDHAIGSAVDVYVCLCNGLTDRHVRDAATRGASRPSEVYRDCGCTRQCGACARMIRQLVDEQGRAPAHAITDCGD
jgi:bacterioferritin-associated ferredoxin